ncbi:hypothetical protein MASR2M78_05820 [Treponema sp.]
MGQRENPSVSFLCFKKSLNIYHLLAWLFCGTCVIAALIQPDLLISMTKAAANPQHLARNNGRGLEGPLYALLNLVALLSLFWLPFGVFIALRLAGKTPEAPFFVFSAIIPV